MGVHLAQKEVAYTKLYFQAFMTTSRYLRNCRYDKNIENIFCRFCAFAVHLHHAKNIETFDCGSYCTNGCGPSSCQHKFKHDQGVNDIPQVYAHGPHSNIHCEHHWKRYFFIDFVKLSCLGHRHQLRKPLKTLCFFQRLPVCVLLGRTSIANIMEKTMFFR